MSSVGEGPEASIADWVLTGPGAPYTVSAERVTVIGRAPASDLVLDFPSVSRRHATLRVLDGRPRLEDAASRYGTCVNGAPIVTETPLTHGDRIQIGSVCLVLQDRGRVARGYRSTVQVGASAPPDIRPTGQHDPLEALVSSLEDHVATGELEGIAWRIDTLLGIWRTTTAIDSALLERAAPAVLAAVTPSRAAWLDAMVELHYVRGLAMTARTLDGLEAALARAPGIQWAALAIYADWLRGRGLEHETPERAALCVARLTKLAQRIRR